MQGHRYCRLAARTCCLFRAFDERRRVGVYYAVQLLDRSLEIRDACKAALSELLADLGLADAQSATFVEVKFTQKSLAFFAAPQNMLFNGLVKTTFFSHRQMIRFNDRYIESRFSATTVPSLFNLTGIMWIFDVER